MFRVHKCATCVHTERHARAYSSFASSKSDILNEQHISDEPVTCFDIQYNYVFIVVSFSFSNSSVMIW